MSGFVATDLPTPVRELSLLSGPGSFPLFEYPYLIEIAGPAGAGKSTLARAVAKELAAMGHPVTIASSARPAELAPASRRSGNLAAALARASKLFELAGQAESHGEISRQILEILPPRSQLWSLRYRRYLSDLERAWQAARASRRIVIFDQGYLSALVALSALARDPPPSQVLNEALRLVPVADLTVCLTAPQEELSRRLNRRLGAQGVLERMFELDIPTSLGQRAYMAMLGRLVASNGIPAMQVESGSLEVLTVSVAAEIFASRSTAPAI